MTCKCAQRVNEKLAEHNAIIVSNMMSNDIRATITLRKQDEKKRGRIPILEASYCPFCGTKYPKARKALNALKKREATIMPGLRMPTPEKLVIAKRPRLSLRDEIEILKHWAHPAAIRAATKRSTLQGIIKILRMDIRCARCGKWMSARSQYEYDHERPRALGGDDTPANMRPYCKTMPSASGMVGCHNLKTARDVVIIAKAKRQAGETGRRNPDRKPRAKPWQTVKRKIPSRKFRRKI